MNSPKMYVTEQRIINCINCSICKWFRFALLQILFSDSDSDSDSWLLLLKYLQIEKKLIEIIEIYYR